MLLKSASFKTVDKVVASNIKKRTASRPKWDTKLRKALIKSKGLPDAVYSYQAHHIVAKGAKRAQRAVEILFALGIDIDDPGNGVFLPADRKAKTKGVFPSAYVYENVHTKPYYANVNFQIITAYENNTDKADIKKLLKDIGEDLKKGVYPICQYMSGAEVYS